MLGSNPGIVAMFVLAAMRSKSLGLISFTKEKLIHICSNFEDYSVSPFNCKSASCMEVAMHYRIFFSVIWNGLEFNLVMTELHCLKAKMFGLESLTHKNG
jgi:hypothetical protein